MDNFVRMFHLQMMLFLLMAVGVLFRRRNIISESGRKTLSDLTVNLVLPCNIIESFLGNWDVSGNFLHNCLAALGISFVIQVVTINREISRLKREKVVFGLPDGIEKYFEEDLYFPQIELENRESVLEYLCNKIVQKGYASEELFANTLEREKIAPTTFANQIAMPHPMRSCAYKTVIAVAVLKKPVFWGNLNVRLVFLLVVRGSDMRYMNSFFDLTSKLMWEKKKIKKLLSLSKFEEFIEELV